MKHVSDTDFGEGPCIVYTKCDVLYVLYDAMVPKFKMENGTLEKKSAR
jgi:hypothetical protein